jgi:MFS family permease
VASNIGTWLQNVAAGWEMTNLSNSPLMVALVQVASALPAFTLAIMAGALADIVDRRRILIIAQVVGALVAALLALSTAVGLLSAPLLLLLTFCMGVQAALQTSAWAANTADIVPRSQLPAAVALGSISFNLSRAAGPAIGGLIVAAFHPALAFALNALSFVAVLAVLLRWKRVLDPPTLPAESLWAAMKSGVRYTREEPAFRALLVRCAGFAIPGTAVFSLLPVVARNSTWSSAYGYSLLLSAIGLGAVAAALLLPRVRQRASRDAIVAGAAVLFAVALAVAAATRHYGWVVAAMPLAGAAWLGTLATLQTAAQTLVPGWVRARALAIYFMTLNGAVAVGGTLWGTLATSVSVPAALGSAAAALLLGLPVLMRYRIAVHELADVQLTSMREHGEAPSPHSLDDVPNDAGPVLVQIEYLVRPEAHAEFIRQMRELGRLRRRDGAYAWECSFDIRDRNRAVETFQVESWLEHLRQHQRLGADFRRLQQHVRGLCAEPPHARHLLSINAGPLPLPPHPPVRDE